MDRLLPARPGSLPSLADLVYELLDALAEIVELASHLTHAAWPVGLDPLRWQAEVDYQRALQRLGRELLAAAAANDPDRSRQR